MKRERFWWLRDSEHPFNKEIEYADIAHPRHVNPELPRYELHRVWVVEAENRPGLRHTFSKIRFYIFCIVS